MPYTIGLGFGTNSARALLVDDPTGDQGILLDSADHHLARQNPRDYLGLTGLLLGQTLYTTKAEIYRALIEATVFGVPAIVERIRDYGVPVERTASSGGIAEKNPLLLQVCGDVTGCEMRLSRSEIVRARLRRFRGGGGGHSPGSARCPTRWSSSRRLRPSRHGDSLPRHRPLRLLSRLRPNHPRNNAGRGRWRL